MWFLTIILCKTPASKEIVFQKSLHQTFRLPFPLHEMALFSLIIGVLIAQALVSLYLLIIMKALPAAFKLKEFAVILGTMVLEKALGHSSLLWIEMCRVEAICV